MKTIQRALIVVLALVGAALAAPGLASAGTFCVNAGAVCPAGAEAVGNLQSAMNTAGARDGDDEILLGDKGTPYVGPFTYTPAQLDRFKHLTIKGVGGRPAITGPSGETVLTLPDGSLEHMTILSKLGEGTALILSHGDLRDLKVVGPDFVAPDLRGLKLSGATLEDVEITGGFEGALIAEGGIAEAGSATGVVARRLHIHGGASLAIQTKEFGGLKLSDSRVSAKQFAISSVGFTEVQRSVLETSDPGSVGLMQLTGSTGEYVLEHVTVAHTGSPSGSDSAFELRAQSPLDTRLHAVAIAGYTRGFRRVDVNGSPENLLITDSVWNPANDELTGHGAGVLVESRNVHAAPELANLAGGDLHPRAGSAAIDRDAVSDLSQFTDLDGVGALDGDGDGIVRPDAGAFEFQPPASPPAGGGAGNGTPASDVAAPVLSKLRLVTGRTRVARAARVPLARAGKLKLAFTASEASRIRIVPRRVVRGKLVKARGAVVRSVGAGKGSIALGKALRRLKLLRPGQLRLGVTATDAAGNRSPKRVLRLRLKE